MSDRELVLDAVRELPENLSVREIVDELLLMDTVRERLAKNPQGKGIAAEALLDQVSTWVTK
jgi:predicted alpha-1,6-mannanase (GH76 family)